MRGWKESTFIFISTNPESVDGGVEQHWFFVMQALMERGATVRFLCPIRSPMGEQARDLGITVDPYILDRWNVIRSRSRLRKYLRRYAPVCAHSTGLEGDLLLRWAARKLPNLHIAHSLTEDGQGTRRRRWVDATMQWFDDLGMRRADAVFVGNESRVGEVEAAGVAPSRIVHVAFDSTGPDEYVKAHIDIYRQFMHGSTRSDHGPVSREG